jgi:hypothetical protein
MANHSVHCRPEELLSHPLGEEIVQQGHSNKTLTMLRRRSEGADKQLVQYPSANLAYEGAEGPEKVLLLRGLRLKAGIDTGSALGGPHSTTGRISYRGRVMNRAARIASSAGSGQVC